MVIMQSCQPVAASDRLPRDALARFEEGEMRQRQHGIDGPGGRQGIEFVDGLADPLLRRDAQHRDCLRGQLEPLVPRQRHRPRGIGQVEDQGIVAEQRQTKLAQCGHHGRLARPRRPAKGVDPPVMRHGRGVQRIEAVDAGHGGIDGAVEIELLVIRPAIGFAAS